MKAKSERKLQQHCSDCGTWIGDTRSDRREAVCADCASIRRDGRNVKQKTKSSAVVIHSSLMPLLVKVASEMRNVAEYTVEIQTGTGRIVVTCVSLIGDTATEA